MRVRIIMRTYSGHFRALGHCRAGFDGAHSH